VSRAEQTRLSEHILKSHDKELGRLNKILLEMGGRKHNPAVAALAAGISFAGRTLRV
jgi:hypothetical protein